MNPIDRARQHLGHKTELLARLRQLSAPEIIVRAAEDEVEKAKAKLTAAEAGTPDAGDPTGPVTFEPPPPPHDDAAVERPPSCAFLGHDAIVCDGSTTRVVGKKRSWPSPDLVIYATSGAHVLYKHVLFTSYHLFDSAKGRWLTAPKAGFPLSFMREVTEQAFVVDVGGEREWRAHEVADYPSHCLASGDGRFLWITDKECNGGIYDGRTGAYVASAEERTLLPLAFAFDGKRFRFFPDKRLMRVTGARAAAFDRTGKRLLVLKKKELLVIELTRLG